MSASLVGSEMCIRDSSSPVLHALAHVEARSGRGVFFCLCCGGAVVAPVSYTHLTLPTICSV
eukprot:449394-Alexandrium_andersonii.AAC.1